nr:bifunctional lysine-specific demethylase and histidyl-hydroxylase mina [Quercus suber]
MERREKKSEHRKRKRKPENDKSLQLLQHADADTIFSLLLAAIHNSDTPSSLTLIKKCLIELKHTFLSQNPNPNPILSLLPFLLTSKSAEIVCYSAEIVGALSLYSLELNEQVGLDGEIVKSLVLALGSWKKRRVLMAACNAVLDMATTPVARQCLLRFFALESLMSGFLQVPKSSVMQVSLCTLDDGTVDDGSVACLKIGIEDDELPVLLLTASIILINSCNIELLGKIPRNLSETFLAFLKNLWAEVHNQILLANTMKSSQEGQFVMSNIRVNNLAESIFRLSINSSEVATTLPVEVVKRKAYKAGYTVALRGMEFRFKCIAAIANGLASIFGQPSVGVNMYLTPPNSQGLARHYDDHCVFVFQLFGTKQWTVFSQPNVQLPRLYGPDSLHDAEVENSVTKCHQILLKEGDILYIPRGVLHEACTDNGGPNGSAACSLHLTLGIEVEPPFEWEGFAHVALCCWNQRQPQDAPSSESLLEFLDVISVNLLHVAIGQIGDSDPNFRKACLVGAMSLPSDTSYRLDQNQKTIFSHLINKIDTESGFLDSLRTIEVAMQKNEDPFQRIRWLRLLNADGETTGHDWNFSLMEASKLFPLCVEHKDKAEEAFMHVSLLSLGKGVCPKAANAVGKGHFPIEILKMVLGRLFLLKVVFVSYWTQNSLTYGCTNSVT